MNLRQANRAKCATNEKETRVCVVQADVVKRLQHHHRHLDLSPPPLFLIFVMCVASFDLLLDGAVLDGHRVGRTAGNDSRLGRIELR